MAIEWPTDLPKPTRQIPNFRRLQECVFAYSERKWPVYGGGIITPQINYEASYEISNPQFLWEFLFKGGYLSCKMQTYEPPSTERAYTRDIREHWGVLLGNCCGGHLVSAKMLYNVSQLYKEVGFPEQLLVKSLQNMVADPEIVSRYYDDGNLGTEDYAKPGALISTTSSRETRSEVVRCLQTFGFKPLAEWRNGKTGAIITQWVLSKGLKVVYGDAQPKS